ncbi:MAG TPA: YggT family protein [Parachlamydiaceae bacterium]|nr:YggT family protein [Parachlamydiaceae bacterium]
MILKLVDLIFQIYLIMLFARILGSWLPVEFQRHKLMQFVNFYTDPYLNVFRKIIPPLGMIDLSPIAAIFCLSFIEKFVKFAVIHLFY